MEAGRDTRCKSTRKKENIMESREEKEESAKKGRNPEKMKKKTFSCYYVYAYASFPASDEATVCAEEKNVLEKCLDWRFLAVINLKQSFKAKNILNLLTNNFSQSYFIK